jgi:uncharacterized protein YecE (DUF72 family)
MQEGKRWLIGTAGAMVSREKWLSIPGLNCLEVNSTFYSLLGEKTAANLAALPDRVSFVFKVSKHITHLKRLNGVGEAWRKFRGSVKDLEKRTTAYLFQLPPSFARNAENVARIEKLAKLVGKGGPQIVVEFRHASWLVPETYALFRKLQWCIAGVLVQRPPDNTRSKKWMGTMPTGVYLPPRTSPMMYFRVHGKPGYRGYVVGGLLKDIAQKMMRTGAKTNAMVFNNVFFDHRTERCTTVPAAGRYAAVCDAAMFAELVERKFVY